MRRGGGGFAVLLASIVTAGQATAQVLGQAPDDSVSFWRVAGTLFLCIGLGIGAILALRARGGSVPTLPALVRRERRLQLIEVLRLNQHVDLCLVLCDDKTMLLAASSHGVDLVPSAKIPGLQEADSGGAGAAA